MKFFTITATIVSALAATATAAPVADDSAKSVHEDFVRATQAMDEFIASNVKHMKRTDDREYYVRFVDCNLPCRLSSCAAQRTC